MKNKAITLTVSQLNRQVRSMLEHEIGEIFVEGEISNLSRPSSGHFYFTLKDSFAQIRCVFFRNRHRLGFKNLENGQQIQAQGMLSLYEARGDFQLIVEELKEAGLGDLYQQFELLKIKLASLGFFDGERKKTIPRFADSIGIISSPTGAAIRDVLSTLARRYPAADVFVYPSDVQGIKAVPQLIQSIERANREKKCSVLILARGGGGIEDLWAFNDERLAMAISSSTIPIISGIGHETDFTIADFVADLRAPTPTGAAEAATPNRIDLISQINALGTRLIAAIHRMLQRQRMILSHQLEKISSPKKLIQSHWQTLDYLGNHLQKALQYRLTTDRQHLLLLSTRLQAQSPNQRIHELGIKIQTIENSLIQNMKTTLNNLQQALNRMHATLQALSPIATLDRGYAIVRHKHHILLESEDVNLKDVLEIQLANGELSAQVIDKK